MVALMKNAYAGTVELPNGKKVRFTIVGVTQIEAKKLLKDANPKARICMKRK